MKTTIELMGNEFTEEAFQQIRYFLGDKSQARVVISIIDKAGHFPPKETKDEYFTRLDKAIKNVEEGNTVSFTWDEFEAHTKQLLNEQ